MEGKLHLLDDVNVGEFDFVEKEAGLVFVTSKTKVFRDVCLGCDLEDVLEIGCCWGSASCVLNERRRGEFLGIDIGVECVESCRGLGLPRSPRFEVLDALNEPRRLVGLMYSEMGFSVCREDHLSVFIDINGSRELESVVALILFVLDELSPRRVVVKSETLADAGIANSCNLIELARESLRARGDRREVKHSYLRVVRGPKRFHPVTKQQICGFHNYSVTKGCSKGDRCPFDHTTCHSCLEPGHRGLDCPKQEYNLLDKYLSLF